MPNKKTIYTDFFERKIIYYPKKRPGFVAWVTAFDYLNGSIGLSFKETVAEVNPSYFPPSLEFGESAGAPVSYSSVEFNNKNYRSYRVYLRSDDNGRQFYETGRCDLQEGSFNNVGFPDGRIIGYDVPRINAEGNGWSECVLIRESTDGGKTWTEIERLFEGTSPYLWRVRRLKNGLIVLLACFYGTSWGPKHVRKTRNTMLPNEAYLNKIQTFFLTSKDGIHFSEPHYILPGIGAHEYDFVELDNGALLFIAGDVQSTPVAKQIIVPSKDGYINESLFPILKGAPADPYADTQGGYVPESVIITSNNLIVGSRRNKNYSCSIDFGENWFEIDSLPVSLYQPFMITFPDGTIANFGHFGGDCSFGQHDMYIGADFFTPPIQFIKAGSLSLQRELSDSKDHYLNRFSAIFTSSGDPLSERELIFRCAPVWKEDGSLNTLPMDQAPVQIHATTDANGVAFVNLNMFDNIPDIHFYYNIDVIYQQTDETDDLLSVQGPMTCVAALTPYRLQEYPYIGYFAEGILYLSPKLDRKYPELIATLKKYANTDYIEKGVLPDSVALSFLQCGLLKPEQDKYFWLKSVHAPVPFSDAALIPQGDWYI